MNRNTRNQRELHKSKVLVGAIVTALALGAAGTATAGAHATADSAYGLSGGVQTLTLQNYLQAVSNQQLLTAPVRASDTDSQAGYRGPAAGGSLTVTGNAFQALTQDTATNLLGANSANNSIDLGLLGIQDDSLPAGDPNQGIGILSGQLATAGVSTLLDHGDIGLDLTDYTAGNATVTGNTLNATTLVDGASNSTTGALNTTPFNSTTTGQVSTHYSSATADLAAGGGVTIGNAQIAAGVDSSARVKDSNIALVNAMTGQDSSGAPVTVTGNTVNAADTGNRGDNRFVAAAGGAVSYTGSVGVVNGQANLDGSTRAMVSGTDIGAELDGTTYTGALSVSGNTLSASAQGNDAAAVDANGNLVRGNVISFGQGIDVTGPAGTGNLSMSFGNSVVDGSADADLALLNSQGNQQNDIVGRIADSNIGAELAGLDGGSLTASDNHAAASAGGNSAINMVVANGSSFDAGVAAGNQQSNDHSRILADASDIVLGVQVDGDDDANTGDVTVSDSSISASANGSSAQTLVDLQGTNFMAGAGDAVDATASNAGFTSLDTGTAGIVVGNLQGNYGAGTRISATAENTDLGVDYDDSGIHDSNVTVGQNAVSVNAGGNSASTSAAAGGATGQLTASVGSGQYNASNIDADVNDARISVESDSHIDGSHVSVGNNAFAATAFANQASNSLSTAFDSSLTLAGGGTGSTIGTSGNQASAALVLLNNQINDGAHVHASLVDAVTLVTTDDLFDSSVDLQGNAFSASAIGNNAGNSLTPAAGSLVRDGDEGTLAALGNLQQISGDSIAKVQDSSVELYAYDETEGAVATLSGNQFSAFAGGNLAGGNGVAGNALHVTGTNLVDASGADTLASYDASTAQQQALAAFTLQNAQSSTAGQRIAKIDDAFIEDGLGEVEDSTLTVSGNAMSAEARDNRAANLLGLDGFSVLATTAVLQSAQTSAGSMNSFVHEVSIGMEMEGADNVDMTVSDNSLSAQAVANTVANQLTVDAVSLGGTAGSGALPAGPAGYRGAVLGEGQSAVVADYGLSNWQTRDGGDIDAGIVEASIGTETWYGDIDGGSSATVTGNMISVLGQGNSAGNALGLTGSGIDATAALFNAQSMQSDVHSRAEDVSIGITADDDMDSAMPLTVTGNSVGVFAGLNDAVNTLNVDADSTIAGNVGLAGASDDGDSYLGFTGAVADFALANMQAGSSTATATLQNVQAGIRADGSIGDTDGDSSLTVSDNQFVAQANGNSASSSVVLNGTGVVGATAAVHNQQLLSGGAISAVANDIGIAAGNEGYGDIDRANLTVSGNQVSGSASGNSASNAIVASAVALNAGFVGTAGTVDAGDASTAIADYALNNVQVNGAAISTSMENVAVGGNIVGSDGALANSMATVSNNGVTGSASGNSASNSIMLASVGGMPSASLVSTQVNNAAISATVNNVTIGVNAGIGSNSPVTVNGNSITASAVGNSVVNHIGIGK